MSESFKDPKFVKLFSEFAEELNTEKGKKDAEAHIK